jgi:malate synthase
MTSPDATPTIDASASIELTSPIPAGCEAAWTGPALEFVARLVREFRPRIEGLLRARSERQASFDRGSLPDFLPHTASVREGHWHVGDLPSDLRDRRVEITGSVDRKMIINALNSGASCFMADLEDSSSPTWTNMAHGQQNLFDAVRRTIAFDDAATGKSYRLVDKPAVLLVRPRGLHLVERHVVVDGLPAPGCLVDFGLYFFNNANELLRRQSGPYFYLPKLESHLEARLWNDVFVAAQRALDVPLGTIKATVLIETLPAAFEMDEILFELRQHSAGLNCGRWDYIFSFIKTLRGHAAFVLPDRSQVTMDQPMMRSYTELVVKTCHRRGVHAMGGMAAQIPIKGDDAANEAALAKVRADKLREVKAGHDGTWVAHPGLVATARAIFDEHMPGPNQVARQRDDVSTIAADLLRVPEGTRTLEGLRHNVRVGVQYLEAWLRGQGCVPLYNLMEDAATAEISRSQVWQWLRHGALVDGDRLTTPHFRAIVAEEMHALREQLGPARFDQGRFEEARNLFDALATSEELAPFLTLAAYELL